MTDPQIDDEIFDEDEQTSANGPSPSIESEQEEDATPKSTKEPLKLKPNRKRQAEEEFKLIKGLSQSIAERRQAQKAKKPVTNPLETFGNYVGQTLSELDNSIRHLAQHRINEILFQAQTGTLRQDNLLGILPPIQAQPPLYQPQPQNYNRAGVNNPPSSLHPQLNVQIRSPSSQPVGLLLNRNISTNIWAMPNIENNNYSPEANH